ncbi:MAG: LacI family DNA-binding transcriptional regulator [Anaerolineaceae bacterium]
MNKKRATSEDVAQLAGVSRTTVSFVLNNVQGVNIRESTRARILKVAKELNYMPNVSGRKLVSGKTNTIGLVLLQSPEQVRADAILINVMMGVEKAATKMGYHVLLKQIDQNTNSYTQLVRENSVDGIILSGPRKDDSEIVDLFHDGFPVVLMGQLPETDLPNVDIDAEAGAFTAVEYLTQLNHKTIAMITNAPLEFTSAQQRAAGYRKALHDAGIEFKPSLLQEGNYTPQSGYEAMNRLLTFHPFPSAVFVASDVVAIGAIQAIHAAGLRIPEDISIIGFDDITLAEYFTPALTTIRLPASELGFAAGEQLLHIIKGEQLETSSIILESKLIVRSSCAPSNSNTK